MAQQTFTLTFTSYSRDFTASMRNGSETFEFFALPIEGGGYAPWQRVRDVPGAIVKEYAEARGQSAAARHTEEIVEIAVPAGTLCKTLTKRVSAGRPARSETEIYRLDGDGDWDNAGIKVIGNRKTAAGGWETVFEIEGSRIAI